MDKRTQFYLDCLKFQAKLSPKVFPHSNLKNFMKVSESDEFNAVLNSGGTYIGEGQYPNTWVAIYENPFDEDMVDQIELVFDVRPSESTIRFVQFILSIEGFLSDPRIKPFVQLHGEKTHWTLLPFQTAEEKWEQYILIRDEQEAAK